MTRSLKRKLIFLLFAAAALVFFVRTVPQVSLTERAVVLGLGVDYEDGEYTVTAQIINPSAGSNGNAQTNAYGITQGKGKSLTDALGEIGIKTGLTLSLSQCNVLVLGYNVFFTDFFPSVNFLVQSFQMPEQAFMIATDKLAVDLIKSSPVMTGISAFQLQQTLTAFEDDESIVNTQIKDFIADYLSKSGTVALAYITAQKMPPDFSGGSSGESASQSDKFEYNYDKTMLISAKLPPIILEKDDTEAINLVTVNLNKGGASAEIDGVRFTLQLSKKKYKTEVSFENGRIKYAGKIKLEYVVHEIENLQEYLSSSDVDKETLKALGNMVAKTAADKIAATFEKCKNAGFDVFEIYDKTYSKEGVKFRDAVGENYLELIDFSITAEASVSRK